ncbi:AraC family transcriptional regulator [Tenacibaculum sp. FZY0031]|uniref:helix-turn-helix domain-containing protein n=1 Tax=Tenacibaculum sp. FZY0031 TaxID=3116648 RepID=UPI002E9C7C1B|nr:AraC family transcriptional regulator [Tenacibaculum sp. FZY0031]
MHFYTILDLNYNIISLIDILGVIQGVILGSLLLFVHQSKRKSTLFLGLFILAYSLEFIPSILTDIKLVEYYPQLTYLPFDFIWLMFPLFYKYVRHISVFPEKSNYIYLYPGILSFIFQLIIFFFPLEIQTTIYESIPYLLFSLLGILYSIWIAIKTVQWINLHIGEVHNQFSKTEKRELQWAKLFVIIGLLFIISSIFAAFFKESFWVALLFSLVNVALLYWVSLRGILQKNISPLFQNVVSSSTTITATSQLSNNKKTSNFTPEKGEVQEKESLEKQELLVKKVTDYIILNKLYIKEDLTIVEVAKAVKKHPKTVSSAINKVRNVNFNTYINTFRIEKAKELLLSPIAQNLSIEGISNEVGFNSKSAFYAAFKKIVGTTPTLYQKQNS